MLANLTESSTSAAPAPPPRRYYPMPLPPGNESRIPVPVEMVNASATVDRIAENLKGLMVNPVEKHAAKTYTASKPPPASAGKPIPPPKPVRSARPHRHASPAAEEDSVVSRHRKEPSVITKDKAPVYGSVPRSTRRDEKPFMPSAATRRRCEMTNVYFLDYYFDLLTYLDQRKQRLQSFKDDMTQRKCSEEEYTKEWKYYCGKERAHLRKRRTRMRLANFSIITQVGQGGYGQVFLAKKNDTKELCALKRMSKKLLHKLGEIQHILTERDILTRTDSPWLVKLLYAFQDADNVYLAMEYVPGGDMRTLLNNSGVLREEHARFYVAEMFMAVAELHRLGYIHRDLKPENFLIDATGHLKLTDFGLSRGALSPAIVESLRIKLDKIQKTPFVPLSTDERRSIHKSIRREDMLAYSLVGSPDYMAPEVLTNNKSGYGLAVDYWSVGCILFECLAGYPPFTASTTDDVWVNVYHWERVLERPRYTGADEEFNLSDNAWSLVTSLVTHAERRFQSLSQVQSHPFFAQYKLTALRSPESPVTPPFVPNLQSSVDTTYFDDFSNPKDMAMYKEVQERMVEVQKRTGPSNTDADKALRAEFVGFTFRHKDSRGWGVDEEVEAGAYVDEDNDGGYTGTTMF